MGRVIKSAVDMQTAISFYKSEMNKQGVTNFRDLDTSKWSDDVPKSPIFYYKSQGFHITMVTGNNKHMNRVFIPLDEAIEFYKLEVIRQGIKAFKKIDKSNWPDNVSKNPSVIYKGFKWSIVTDNAKDRAYVSISEAIEFYKSEMVRQSITNVLKFDKSTWPKNNVPTTPVRHYENFSWSLVTGNLAFSTIARQNREQVVKIITDNIDNIDYMDDMTIAILLSKVCKKAKLSSLISSNIKRKITEIVNNKEQGSRSQDLMNLANDVINSQTNDIFKDDVDEVDEISDTDDIVYSVDESDLEPELTYEDVKKKQESLHRNNLESKIKAIEKSLINSDLDPDYKNLIKNNGLKYMWYLEVKK